MTEDDRQTRRDGWTRSSRLWEGIWPSRASRRLSWSRTRAWSSAAWPAREWTPRASPPWRWTPSQAPSASGSRSRPARLDTMSIEFEGLTVVFAPFTPDVMLALLAAPGSVGILLGQLSDGRGVPVQAPRGGA